MGKEVEMKRHLACRATALWCCTAIGVVLTVSLNPVLAEGPFGPWDGGGLSAAGPGRDFDPAAQNGGRLLMEGQRIFRFDTFGDEAFWGGGLRLHEAVATLTPRQALQLGLKVDSRRCRGAWCSSCGPGG